MPFICNSLGVALTCRQVSKVSRGGKALLFLMRFMIKQCIESLLLLELKSILIQFDKIYLCDNVRWKNQLNTYDYAVKIKSQKLPIS